MFVWFDRKGAVAFGAQYAMANGLDGQRLIITLRKIAIGQLYPPYRGPFSNGDVTISEHQLWGFYQDVAKHSHLLAERPQGVIRCPSSPLEAIRTRYERAERTTLFGIGAASAYAQALSALDMHPLRTVIRELRAEKRRMHELLSGEGYKSFGPLRRQWEGRADAFEYCLYVLQMSLMEAS